MLIKSTVVDKKYHKTTGKNHINKFLLCCFDGMYGRVKLFLFIKAKLYFDCFALRTPHQYLRQHLKIFMIANLLFDDVILTTCITKIRSAFFTIRIYRIQSLVGQKSLYRFPFILLSNLQKFFQQITKGKQAAEMAAYFRG